MPTNKKEGILFGLMMVFGMATVMYSHNLIMEGLWMTMSATEVLVNLLITTMSTYMVTGMVLSMSVYGLVLKGMSTGIEGAVVHNYIRLIGQNFIKAYPLQLLVVGPLARWVLTTFIQNRNQAEITFSKS